MRRDRRYFLSIYWLFNADKPCWSCSPCLYSAAFRWCADRGINGMYCGIFCHSICVWRKHWKCSRCGMHYTSSSPPIWFKVFEVHIYGDGSNLENCIQLVNQLREDQKIIFHGRVTGDELIHAYEKIDAFLLTLRGDNAVGMTMPAKFAGIYGAWKACFCSHWRCGRPCDYSSRMRDGGKGVGWSWAGWQYAQVYWRSVTLLQNWGWMLVVIMKSNFTKDVFIDKLEKIFIEMKDGRELCLQEKLYWLRVEPVLFGNAVLKRIFRYWH